VYRVVALLHGVAAQQHQSLRGVQRSVLPLTGWYQRGWVYRVVALLHGVAAQQHQSLRGVQRALHVAERTPLGRHERACVG
jgi:hypothetical protein